MACGATYLSWNDSKSKEFSELQYKKCIKMIKEIIINDIKSIEKSEEVLLCLMVLCLREKYQCKDRIRNSLFLIASSKIINWLILYDNELKYLKQCGDYDLELRKFTLFQQELNEIVDLLSNGYDTLNQIEPKITLNKAKNQLIDDNLNNILNNILIIKTVSLSIELIENKKIVTSFEKTESYVYNY